jgi:uncharacterized membrane protein YhhN
MRWYNYIEGVWALTGLLYAFRLGGWMGGLFGGFLLATLVYVLAFRRNAEGLRTLGTVGLWVFLVAGAIDLIRR